MVKNMRRSKKTNRSDILIKINKTFYHTNIDYIVTGSVGRVTCRLPYTSYKAYCRRRKVILYVIIMCIM